MQADLIWFEMQVTSGCVYILSMLVSRLLLLESKDDSSYLTSLPLDSAH